MAHGLTGSGSGSQARAHGLTGSGSDSWLDGLGLGLTGLGSDSRARGHELGLTASRARAWTHGLTGLGSDLRARAWTHGLGLGLTGSGSDSRARLTSTRLNQHSTHQNKLCCSRWFFSQAPSCNWRIFPSLVLQGILARNSRTESTGLLRVSSWEFGFLLSSGEFDHKWTWWVFCLCIY
jgi:hypothetical protein